MKKLSSQSWSRDRHDVFATPSKVEFDYAPVLDIAAAAFDYKNSPSLALVESLWSLNLNLKNSYINYLQNKDDTFPYMKLVLQVGRSFRIISFAQLITNAGPQRAYCFF